MRGLVGIDARRVLGLGRTRKHTAIHGQPERYFGNNQFL